MYKVATAQIDDDTDTSTGAFERAGFRVEKVGRTTVVERDLPDEVVEATRVLVNRNGNGKANGNGLPDAERVSVPREGPTSSGSNHPKEKEGSAG